jgi:excisionase family DNA binding protein
MEEYMIMAEAQFLTVAQVCERLQVTPNAVRRWLTSGQLGGVRLGGKRTGWRISEDDLQAFIAMRRGGGDDGGDA